MKKFIAVSLLGVFVMGFCATDVFARRKKFEPPDHYLTLSFFISPWSVGYKHLLSRNLYLTGNLDYSSGDEDLIFQAGAAYMVPRKILIFRFFGGGGLEFSRNNTSMYPYVTIGTKLWILHFEIIHPLLRNRSPGYRFGFIFPF